MYWFYESRRPTRRPTMGELRAKAERVLEQEKAKSGKSRRSHARNPVRVEGRTIARSFWGKAWCAHIASYSDYESRLGRGRSYLYAGAVLDLQVGEGIITAEVQGSSRYHQTIEVEKLDPKQRAELRTLAAGKIESLVALLRGQLPPALLTAMTDPTHGVFPTSEQIDLRCSCPDPAMLCKHLAAALYGFGARLDAAPELVFRLRGLDLADLVQTGATALAVPDIAPTRQSADDLSALFGIDLVDIIPAAKPRTRPVRVEREYLKVLGIAPRVIDAWLREGVLRRTPEHNTYERTPEADRRIAEMLAQ